jgi:hypothetical protein
MEIVDFVNWTLLKLVDFLTLDPNEALVTLIELVDFVFLDPNRAC